MWLATGLLLLLAGAATTAHTAPAAADTDATHYSFAVVPQFEQRRLFKIWRPLLNELERRTGLKFELIGTHTIPAFEREFMRGAFDFAYMNPYHIVAGHRTQGYEPLVRDGVRQLRGIIVVRKDSPFTSLADLDGHTIAFPSPNALGAALLPRADLQEAKVKYESRYTQTHTSVYLHVAKGLVDAGGGVRSTLDVQSKELKAALRILHETRGLSSHPICAHSRVPMRDRERVRRALLEMGEDAKGRALLAGIPMEKPVAARLEDYRVITDWGLERLYIPQ
jgi:phosphonate transport system substrate-binding protein